MTTCPYLARMEAFHDGEVTPDERLQLQTHLAQCPLCQNELAQLSRLSLTFQNTPLPPISPQFWPKLHTQIRIQNDRHLLHTAYSLLALAASLFVVFTLWVQLQNTTTPSQPSATSWELTATNYSADTTNTTPTEVATAQWIVEDLSQRDNHD